MSPGRPSDSLQSVCLDLEAALGICCEAGAHLVAGHRRWDARVGSCGAWAVGPGLLSRGVFLDQGSPALAGGFPTTEPPGKSLTEFFEKAFLTQAVKKAMAPLSTTLAWKIAWREEPGRLQSMGSLGVGHD